MRNCDVDLFINGAGLPTTFDLCVKSSCGLLRESTFVGKRSICEEGCKLHLPVDIRIRLVYV